MKKFVKIILILIIVISITNISFATEGYSISNMITDAQNFTQSGNSVESMINTTALKNTSTFIYKTLFSIGLVVAIIVGIILGIQFMIASAEDKAKVKETLIAYVVGCVVLFGAYGIWRTVIYIVQETTSI